MPNLPAVGRSNSKEALGFLSVVDLGAVGLCGGYLILNARGRPLEFHCTAPLKPNRAQQILYGPTLEPFLYGEQIGQTLTSKCRNQPWIIFTDHPAALAVREFVETPVALVMKRAEDASISVPPAGLVCHSWEGHSLAVPFENGNDLPGLTNRLDQWPTPFELAEPFQRIREAIGEAQQAARLAG